MAARGFPREPVELRSLRKDSLRDSLEKCALSKTLFLLCLPPSWLVRGLLAPDHFYSFGSFQRPVLAGPHSVFFPQNKSLFGSWASLPSMAWLVTGGWRWAGRGRAGPAGGPGEQEVRDFHVRTAAEWQPPGGRAFEHTQPCLSESPGQKGQRASLK